MNNEEKILEVLGKLVETVDKHGEALEKLTKKVDEQGELLREVDDRSLRSAVMLENQVLPQLQLLYEGQVNLQQTLAPKERVDDLEERVITLETVIKSTSKRLSALEKAQ